jgi:hypothetical protein
MTMIEKVAQAIFDVPMKGIEEASDHKDAIIMAIARAAIEAMREPNATIDRLFNDWDCSQIPESRDAMSLLVDAALKDQ